MTKDIDYSGTKGVLDEYEEIVAKEGFSDSDGVSCGQLMLEVVDTTDDSTEDLKPVDILSPMTVDDFISSSPLYGINSQSRSVEIVPSS